MTHRRSDFEFNDFFGKEPERPSVASLGRIRKPHRDDFGFLRSVEAFGSRRRVSFFSVERDVETFDDKFSSHIFDALCGAEKRFGDFLIFPVWSVGVRPP